MAVAILGRHGLRIANTDCAGGVPVLSNGEAEDRCVCRIARLTGKGLGNHTEPELGKPIALDVDANGVVRGRQSEPVAGEGLALEAWAAAEDVLHQCVGRGTPTDGRGQNSQTS